MIGVFSFAFSSLDTIFNLKSFEHGKFLIEKHKATKISNKQQYLLKIFFFICNIYLNSFHSTAQNYRRLNMSTQKLKPIR